MVVSITGGLGNQMFQYAFGYAHSRRHKEDLKLDIFYLGLDKQRRLDIDEYDLSHKKMGRFRGAVYYSVRKLIKNGISLRSWNRISRSVVEVSPLDYQCVDGDNLFAVGSWQHLRYFEEYREELLEEFRYCGRLKREQSELKERIAKEDSLAVHIRRGDYLNPQNSAYRIVEKGYYMNAINYLREKCNVSAIYFFSDDIDWCKEEFKQIQDAKFVDGDISGDPHVDMELMRNCKYFIIANSTFSWWGAWLSVRDDKVMLAPKNWFNEKKNEIYNIRVKSALLKDFVLMDE